MSNVKIPGLSDNDLLILHRGGTDYKTTAAELREYLTTEPPEPPKPWDSGLTPDKIPVWGTCPRGEDQ